MESEPRWTADNPPLTVAECERMFAQHLAGEAEEIEALWRIMGFPAHNPGVRYIILPHGGGMTHGE